MTVPSTDRAPQAGEGPPRARRLLLVEDHAAVREMTRALLESSGHEVLIAEDGEAGAAAILRHRPDAALVDIGLPKLDGYGVARRVRAQPGGERCLLIAVTGYGQPEDRRRALDAGFNAHLVKPVDLEELALILSQLEPPQ